MKDLLIYILKRRIMVTFAELVIVKQITDVGLYSFHPKKKNKTLGLCIVSVISTERNSLARAYTVIQYLHSFRARTIK